MPSSNYKASPGPAFPSPPNLLLRQRDKKGKPLVDKEGKLMPLTSHTLAPVPVFIGGKGLPVSVVFWWGGEGCGGGLSWFRVTGAGLGFRSTVQIHQYNSGV